MNILVTLGYWLIGFGIATLLVMFGQMIYYYLEYHIARWRGLSILMRVRTNKIVMENK